MISTTTHFTSRIWMVVLATAISLASGCGKDDQGVDPSKQLCRGRAGVGARIAGTPAPMEFCAPDGAVSTHLGDLQPGRYDIMASFTEDSVTVELEISFFAEAGLPKVLLFTPDPAVSNPGEVWFFYRESTPNAPAVNSLSVSGVFTLTFAEPSIVVATFNTLTIELETDTGQRAGTRTISEGFLNLSVD